MTYLTLHFKWLVSLRHTNKKMIIRKNYKQDPPEGRNLCHDT